MKTITEILGGAQVLLGISFDIQDIFEEYLTKEHRAFLSMLRVIEEYQPAIDRAYHGRGRMPYNDPPIVRAFYAKSFFKIATNVSLIQRLKSDSSLRRICGFNYIPSEATFSRRINEFADRHIQDQTLYKIVQKYCSKQIIGHISRDSTAIEAREKPENKKKDVAILNKPKRGRPRKGESRPVKRKKRLFRQLAMTSGKALKELDTAYAWGCKKNSQGNVQFWKGYKLHLDVTDTGIPVTAFVTGANVHDSQTAIPMEKLTERNVTHLYSLMDAAYDAPEIRGYIEGRGRVALIDHNKRRKDFREPMSPAMKQRFKIRSTVERANSHLKDWLLPSKLTVRGHKKVTFCMMTGVVCLAAIKILQYFILPGLEASG